MSLPYIDLYYCGDHSYTHDELQANLRACGYHVEGSGLDAILTGSPDLIDEARSHIDRDIFFAEWDSLEPGTGPQNKPPRCYETGCRESPVLRGLCFSHHSIRQLQLVRE